MKKLFCRKQEPRIGAAPPLVRRRSRRCKRNKEEISIDGTGQVGTNFYTAPEIEQRWPQINEKVILQPFICLKLI
ncbi:putative serine/threonine-protein kinase GCN2 [Platanthera guangdongensis]|uniref:Serine/threonine-protein kinase GCN2 n=1 Tax=Platanthera guangdongensis TaxID=2320717 RepID=A0ABR2M5L1_9ASPA